MPRAVSRSLAACFRHESRSRKLGGTGLGLAIVARILAWHGGRVHVADSDLDGAELVTWWPAEAPSPGAPG